MFQASSCPSSGATIAVAASGLPSELGDSSAVGRGRAGRLNPRATQFCTVTPNIYGSFSMGLASCNTCGANGFEVAPRLFVNLCTTVQYTTV